MSSKAGTSGYPTARLLMSHERKPPPDEINREVVGPQAPNYIRCPECGGYIDIRDLEEMPKHAGPLPHPTEDTRQ